MAPMNSKIQQLVESLAEEVLQEVLRGFKLYALRGLEDQAKKINYADKHLPLLGEGSSRTVYALGSNKVLKIAGRLWPRGESFARVDSRTSQRGRAQNEQEVNLYTNPKTKPVVAKIYDFDPEYYSWIVSELVRPFRSETEFFETVGVDEWVFQLVAERYVSKKANFDLNKAIDWAAKTLWDEVEKYGQRLPLGAEKVESKEQMHDWVTQLFAQNTFLKNAIHLADLGSSVGDLTEWKHWGKTIDGDVKLLDYGVTREIMKRLY